MASTPERSDSRIFSLKLVLPDRVAGCFHPSQSVDLTQFATMVNG